MEHLVKPGTFEIISLQIKNRLPNLPGGCTQENAGYPEEICEDSVVVGNEPSALEHPKDIQMAAPDGRPFGGLCNSGSGLRRSTS